jgi:hypothetical protein
MEKKMSNTFFRKSSLDSISSPDQLNDYIKVSTPSLWVIIIALFVLLASVFVWGFTGRLPTTASAPGVSEKGNVVCYINVEDSRKIKAGQTAIVSAGNESKISGKVASVGDIPMSQSEIAAELGSDYLVHVLTSKEFAVKVNIILDGSTLADNTLLNVSILTESIRPLDFLIN